MTEKDYFVWNGSEFTLTLATYMQYLVGMNTILSFYMARERGYIPQKVVHLATLHAVPNFSLYLASYPGHSYYNERPEYEAGELVV